MQPQPHPHPHCKCLSINPGPWKQQQPILKTTVKPDMPVVWPVACIWCHVNLTSHSSMPRPWSTVHYEGQSNTHHVISLILWHAALDPKLLHKHENNSMDILLDITASWGNPILGSSACQTIWHLWQLISGQAKTDIKRFRNIHSAASKPRLTNHSLKQMFRPFCESFPGLPWPITEKHAC